MLRPFESLRQFRNMQHSAKRQANALYFIAHQVEVIHHLRLMDGCPEWIFPMEPIYRECQKTVTPEISLRQLAQYWNIYMRWGELPAFFFKRQRYLRKKMNVNENNNRTISKQDLSILKEIVDEKPYLYLDEIVLEFGKETNKYLSISWLSRLLRQKLKYSLKVMMEVAKQRKKEEEIVVLLCLAILLDGDPTRLCLVDESSKDNNAARRGLGWSPLNLPCILREWFQKHLRYCLMAAADINGFIPCACHCVHRDCISDQGASGTVDGDYFLYWVKEYLCPILGSYLDGEPCSVVYMDNASTHMSEEVEHAIRSTGAILIYGPPYSPHLNPIEKYFSVYKAYLKRHNLRFTLDWEEVHLEALNAVTRDTGINFFRTCQIPGSFSMFTTAEWEQKLQEYY